MTLRTQAGARHKEGQEMLHAQWPVPPPALPRRGRALQSCPWGGSLGCHVQAELLRGHCGSPWGGRHHGGLELDDLRGNPSHSMLWFSDTSTQHGHGVTAVSRPRPCGWRQGFSARCATEADPRVSLPGASPTSREVLLSASTPGLPATLDWWNLCRSSWQHFPSFTQLSFSVSDAFDLCLGFIGLINIISAVSSMLTEIIPNNVLLIPVTAEWEQSYAGAYGSISYLWWLSLAF